MISSNEINKILWLVWFLTTKHGLMFMQGSPKWKEMKYQINEMVILTKSLNWYPYERDFHIIAPNLEIYGDWEPHQRETWQEMAVVDQDLNNHERYKQWMVNGDINQINSIVSWLKLCYF